jgi:NADPH2:quinone reductase
MRTALRGEQMKAVLVKAFGTPEVLVERRIPRPKPGAGEVLVHLHYAGVNFLDIQMRNGSYARSQTYETPLPMTIGMEGAGTVSALGEGVDKVELGDRVSYCIVPGSYAEYTVVPEWRLVKVPARVPLDIATTLMMQGMTAQYLTSSTYQLGRGSTCLVHAAAGGVGRLLVQLAKYRGARVIATVGTREKAVIARALGADEVILYREIDFHSAILDLTDGRGVDVVYDAVGIDTIAGSIRSTRRRGLCVLYGGSSGLVSSIAPQELAEAGSIFFTRPHLADHLNDAAEIGGRAAELFALLAAGKVQVSIHAVLPLAQAAEAHRILEAGQTRGKLLLKIDEKDPSV